MNVIRHPRAGGDPFTRGGLYASIQIQAFINLWPQKAGFPPPFEAE